MYQGFLGLAGLSLLPLLHCMYLWKQSGGGMPVMTRFQKVFLPLLAGVYLLALAGGIILWVIRFEPAAVYVMGLAMLVGAMVIHTEVRQLINSK